MAKQTKREMNERYLEREVLLQLAELFNLSLDLCLAPFLDQLLLSKRNLLALALSIRITRFR